MRLARSVAKFVAAMAAAPSLVAGERMLMSSSLNSCQDNSKFEASLFNVTYMPDKNSAEMEVQAVSSVQGKAIFDISVIVYGWTIINKQFDPCATNDFKGLCPMVAGKTRLTFTIPVDDSTAKQVPGIAYTIPDLDATVRVKMNLTDDGNKQIACVEADISNGKTVDLVGVKWTTAIIAALALLASGVVSSMGYLNTAAHVAANSLSLFGYFQAQAIIGLSGVPLPPIVQSWTQNFQWSMGIIRVGFMQQIFTWYQRATGGTPSQLFSTLATVSVQVEKRSLDMAEASMNLMKRGFSMLPTAVQSAASSLVKRDNIKTGSGSYLVYGIQRVAFKSKIESTNLFITSLTFFCLLVIFTALGVAIFKGACELGVKRGMLGHDRFLDFRNGWRVIMKGIMFRVCLIGFPLIAILCLWELTQIDSPALAVLAVVFFLSVSITLGWGTSKVIRIARRSITMHSNPAYILFSDPRTLNKWGFLYIQFRAPSYYFIVPFLGYLLLKSIFIAFAQKAPLAQAIGLLIIELAALVASSVLKPWMDKPTNSFNIAICSVNFINAICLMIFCDVFGAPGIVKGSVGVVFFVLNAAFSLILLLMVMISTGVSLFRSNPDARYQVMGDDRASFMRSQTALNTDSELDALAATARGDKGGYKAGQLDLDDDGGHLHPQYNANKAATPSSPVNPSMPMFPATREQSPFRAASPADSAGSHIHGSNASSSGGYRQVNNASPWKRGAGYE